MVGWEPVLFQVLWVFKILTHLQLHYDQTVSHAWSDRGQTVECLNFCVECPYFSVECLNFCVVPLPPKIYRFWIILVYLCTCSICVHANKGLPRIATAGHVGQCRISNLHWFKCHPTCPQDDFHACMKPKQSKFTRAIFICEKLNYGTPTHLWIIWDHLGKSRTPTLASWRPHGTLCPNW